MDQTTYPCSDTDNNGLDFINQWLDFTVQKEVLRGSKLRDEKQKNASRDDCGVLKIEYVKPPCVGNSYYSRTRTERNNFKTSPCGSQRTNSPYWRNCSSYYNEAQADFSRPITSRLKAKCPPSCPLRIVELAVPTKRQCIDTWRNKCDVLPPFMVERLRQQIIDEKPIVQIADAVSCFTRRKPKSVKSMKRPKKNNRDLNLKNDRMIELKKICTAFAKKIAHKLITPQNLKLNPELNKIAKIVSDEIANIMKSNKIQFDKIDQKIYCEISEMIAVWIANILEDTSAKLLDEDLRDLEEEEGFVLDFLDDVIDNVMKICVPPSGDIGDYSETTSKASGEQNYGIVVTSDSLENYEIDTSTPYKNMTYDTRENMTINKNNYIGLEHSRGTVVSSNKEDPFEAIEFNDSYFRNEIDIIVDSINVDDAVSELIIDDKSKHDTKFENDHATDNIQENDSFIDYNIHVNNIINANSSIQNNDTSHDNDVEEEIDHYEIVDDDDVRNKLDLNNLPEISEQNPENFSRNVIMPIDEVTVDSERSSHIVIHTNDLEEPKIDNNVSDVFEILTEESSDAKIKKVTFLQIDLGVRKIIKQSDEEGAQQLLGHDVKTSRPVSVSTKNNLIFAPANVNLLSEADESWPKDIPTDVVKTTASISRSVTSLGNILENDEKLSIAIEENVKHKSDHTLFKGFEIRDVKEISNNYDNNDNLQSKLDLIHSKKDSSQEIYVNKVEIEGTVVFDKLRKKNISNKTLKKDPKDEILGYSTVSLETPRHYKASNATSEKKFDYKVNPNTAPSWVIHDHGKNESIEDSIKYKKKEKRLFKENEVRLWCKDLERMFANLDLWSRWLDTICKYMTFLKQRRDMNKLLCRNPIGKDTKEWVKLKKNIDEDAILWTIYQRIYERSNNYQQKINEIVSTECCVLCNCNNGYNNLTKS